MNLYCEWNVPSFSFGSTKLKFMLCWGWSCIHLFYSEYIFIWIVLDLDFFSLFDSMWFFRFWRAFSDAVIWTIEPSSWVNRFNLISEMIILNKNRKIICTCHASLISNKVAELGYRAQSVCRWLNSFYTLKTETFLNLGLYFNLACFNFRSLYWFNQHWQSSSIRICCKSGSSSSLNSLLCLELLDTWLRWPVMILSKRFMIKVKPTMSDFESIWCNTNDGGFIVAASEFSEVTILGRFTFMPHILLNKIFIKGYEYKFKLYI